MTLYETLTSLVSSSQTSQNKATQVSAVDEVTGAKPPKNLFEYCLGWIRSYCWLLYFLAFLLIWTFISNSKPCNICGCADASETAIVIIDVSGNSMGACVKTSSQEKCIQACAPGTALTLDSGSSTTCVPNLTFPLTQDVSAQNFNAAVFQLDGGNVLTTLGSIGDESLLLEIASSKCYCLQSAAGLLRPSYQLECAVGNKKSGSLFGF